MSFLNLNQEADAQAIDQMASTPLDPADLGPGAFAGLWKAPAGVASGVVSMAAAAVDATYNFTTAGPQGKQFYDQMRIGLGFTGLGDYVPEDPLKMTRGWREAVTLNPRTTGLVTHALYGLGKIIPEVAVTGPEGAAAIEGYESVLRAKDMGLTDRQALILGTIEGAATYAGLKIPVDLVGRLKVMGKPANTPIPRTLWDIPTAAAGFAGFGMVSRGGTAAYLESIGHPEIAKSYEVFDATAITMDLIMGGGFGAWHQMSPALGKWATDQYRNLRGLPSLRETALSMSNAIHAQVESAQGFPLDEATKAAHVETMAQHIEALLRGETPPPPKPGAIDGNYAPNPSAEASRAEFAEEATQHLDSDVSGLQSELAERGLPTDDSLYNVAPDYRSVLARDPLMEEAALRLKAGEITPEQYRRVADARKPVRPYTEVPEPATLEDLQRALTSDKQPRIGAPDTLAEGHPVGLRLDIPAYKDHGVWVVSVHEKQPGWNAGPSIGYTPAAAATNVTLGVRDTGAMHVATGGQKAPFAVMKGEWRPITPEQAKAEADAAMHDPNWVQVGMDPTRRQFFYDRKTMQPVVAADEVIQVGPLVLAKNPRYGDVGEHLFNVTPGEGSRLNEPVEPAETVDPAAVLGEGTPVRFTDNVRTMYEEWLRTKDTQKLLNDLARLNDRLQDRAILNEMKRNRSLVRGELYIRERLLRAERQGEISTEVRRLAFWILDRNPAAARELGISIRQGDGSADGSYSPLRRIVTLFTHGSDNLTGAHEILHHLERFMPPEIQHKIREAYLDGLQKELDAANKAGDSKRVQHINDAIASAAGDRAAFSRIQRAVLNREVDPSFYQWTNPSEYWAYHASRLVRDRADAEGWVARARQYLGEFIEKAKSAFGIDSNAPIIRGLDAVLNADREVNYRMLRDLNVSRNGVLYDITGQRRVATWFSGFRTVEAALEDIQSAMAVEYDGKINDAANAAWGTSYITRGVESIDPKELRDANVTLFHASPVCKNFSAAKTVRGATELDRRSAEAVARAITEATPPIVTVENVPAYKDTALFALITDALTQAGYKWDVVVHNATDFGAAQSRERMLLRAVRDGELPPLPEKVPPGDWYEVMSDLIPDAPDSEIPPVERSRLDDMIANGRLDASRPIITMGGSGFKNTWAAANDGGPSPTLKAANEKPRIIMPDGTVKEMTSRMMARLMGLPDTFQVPESGPFAKKVLGNGVHGNVTKALIAPLLERFGNAPLAEGQTHVVVDGVSRSALNSHGDPIHWSEQGVANFWRWFGDSKTVDDQGRPIVVYRGTRRAPKGDRFVMTNNRYTSSWASDPAVASVYSRQLNTAEYGSGSTVTPNYMAIKKPFDVRHLGENTTLDQVFGELKVDYSQEFFDDGRIGVGDIVEVLRTLDDSVYNGNASYDIEGRDSDGYAIRDFDELADAVEALAEKGQYEEIDYLLSDASVDVYALADNETFVDMLESNGFDGVIHKDVFDVGAKYYEGNLSSLEEGDTGPVIDAYRPFEQTGMKSALGNTGGFDADTADTLLNVSPSNAKRNVADVVSAFNEAALVSDRDVLKTLGEYPQYLRGVADFMMQQRDKLVAGKMTVRDVAKAYFITISSMGSGAKTVKVIEAKTGMKVPERFAYGKKIRPEEAAALWLGTPAGKQALDLLEKGQFDEALWEQGAGVRRAYGDDRLKNMRVFAQGVKGYNMRNLQQLVDRINEAGKARNFDAIQKELNNLSGIGQGKIGFIKHMVGLGNTPTIDAVEINFWITGKGDIAQLKNKAAALARDVKKSFSNKRMSKAVFDRVSSRFARLQKKVAEGQIDPDVFNHIFHHWLWDRAKGIETTHGGMYEALELYNVTTKADVAEAMVKEDAGEHAVIATLDKLVPDERIRTITFEDLRDELATLTVADRTKAGALYTGVDGSLTVAVQLPGGPFFPLRESNMKAGVGWADRGEGVATQKENKAAEGAKVMLVMLGAPNMHKSNKTVATAFVQTLRAYARDGRISADNFAALDALVRSTKTEDKNVQNIIDEFPGFENEEALDKFLSPENMTFNASKRLLEILGSKKAQNLGAPSLSKVLKATAEPSLAGLNWGDSVLAVRIDENLKFKLGADKTNTLPHPDYPIGIRGTVIGKFEVPVNWEVLYSDWLDGFRKAKVEAFNYERSSEYATSGETWKDRIAYINNKVAAGELSEWAGKLAAENILTKYKKEGTPQEFDATPNDMTQAEFEASISPRRSFELTKPILKITQDVIEKTNQLRRTNIESPMQAQRAIDWALDRWRESGKTKENNGVAPQHFLDMVAESDDSASMRPITLKDIKAGVKDKSLRLYSLGEEETAGIWLALKSGAPDKVLGLDIPGLDPTEVVVTHIVNNELGASGIGRPAAVLKALQEGATMIDCMTVKTPKHPSGFLTQLYEAFGFDVVHEVPFKEGSLSKLELADLEHQMRLAHPEWDPARDGYPSRVILKWSGTDAERRGVTERYLADGVAAVLSGRTRPDVQAAETELAVPDSAAAGQDRAAADAGGTGGNQDAGLNSPVASRLGQVASDVANLPDLGIKNLGLSREDVAAVREKINPYSPEGLAQAKPKMQVPLEDGTPVPAAQALASADAEIAKAQKDSQGFDVAAACALSEG